MARVSPCFALGGATPADVIFVRVPDMAVIIAGCVRVIRHSRRRNDKIRRKSPSARRQNGMSLPACALVLCSDAWNLRS